MTSHFHDAIENSENQAQNGLLLWNEKQKSTILANREDDHQSPDSFKNGAKDILFLPRLLCAALSYTLDTLAPFSCPTCSFTLPDRSFIRWVLPLVFWANLTLHQSYASELREKGPGSTLNGDGFGVGWYADTSGTPCIFTSISPAWNNRNLLRLSHKILSPLIFAHIRAASPGSPTNESNCHPFQYRQFMWMHNGHVADFHLVKRRLITYISDECFNLVEGTTDSEYCFVLYLHVLFTTNGTKVEQGAYNLEQPIPDSQYYSPEVLYTAMTDTIALLNCWINESGSPKHSMLNFCLTDGRTLVSTRYANTKDGPAASLFYSSGTKFERNPRDPERYIMSQADRRQMCHIIASEPLTDDKDDWVQVPRNHMVVVTPQSNLLLFSIPENKSDPEHLNNPGMSRY